MSHIYLEINDEDIELLRELEKKSTQVIGWYAHPSQVRGPFNRWFEVTDVPEKYKHEVASKSDDAVYCATVMSMGPALISKIDSLKSQLTEANALIADSCQKVAEIEFIHAENVKLRAKCERYEAALKEIISNENMIRLARCCVDETCFRHHETNICSFQTGVNYGNSDQAGIAREALGQILK